MKLKIKISIHKSKSEKALNKMDGLNSINSYPLHNTYCKDNNNCKDKICHYCYAIYLLSTIRFNCIPPFKINDDLLSNRILQDSEIPFLNYGIIRYNSYGELLNYIHFINYCIIAKNNIQCQFTLFTKRKNIVQKYYKYIPKNLILIYSSCKLNKREKLPKHFDKVFTVYTDEFYTNNNIHINCIGQCKNCKICYSQNNTIHISEIVRQKEFKHFKTIRNKLQWEI